MMGIENLPAGNGPSLDALRENGPAPKSVGPCCACGAASEFLCDFVVSEAPRKTCDRPICEAHARCIGGGFACRRVAGGGSGQFSIDYCPEHAAAADIERAAKARGRK